MIGKKVNWYRNAFEKDKDTVHGTGTLVAINMMEGNAESSVAIVDGEGNFIEKPFSLVRMVKEKTVASNVVSKAKTKKDNAFGLDK